MQPKLIFGETLKALAPSNGYELSEISEGVAGAMPLSYMSVSET